MTFALTSFFADGVRYMGPGPVRATQTYGFTITSAATDVDLDLGDATGTFWTAATANSTYGTMATQVLDRVNRLQSNYTYVKSVFSPELFPREVVSASPTGTTQMTQSIDADLLLPDYGFGTTGGLTAYTIHVEYQMEPNMLPTNLFYNIG